MPLVVVATGVALSDAVLVLLRCPHGVPGVREVPEEGHAGCLPKRHNTRLSRSWRTHSTDVVKPYVEADHGDDERCCKDVARVGRAEERAQVGG